MTMAPSLRKLALTAHIVSSVGWIGALVGFLVLAIVGLASADLQTVRAVYIAMDLTARFAIVPLALISLSSGIIQALATPWGLFRHYWVLFKLLIIVIATFMLLMKTGPINDGAGSRRGGILEHRSRGIEIFDTRPCRRGSGGLAVGGDSRDLQAARVNPAW